MKYAITALLLLGLLSSSAEAGVRARNKIQYSGGGSVKLPKTSAYVVDKDVMRVDRKENGWGANGDRWGREHLISWWQRGTSWFSHGRFTKAMRWAAGTGILDRWWNHWDEDGSMREVHTAGGKGPPAWRYRRTEFVFKNCWPVAGCVASNHSFAAQTFRTSAKDPYTGSHGL